MDAQLVITVLYEKVQMSSKKKKLNLFMLPTEAVTGPDV